MGFEILPTSWEKGETITITITNTVNELGTMAAHIFGGV